jgi:hypothetical protein
MPETPKDFSRDSLERLVARALELDEQGSERISLTQAREIARELGISETAWDAAVAERVRSGPVPVRVARGPWVGLQTLLTAGVGFGAGALGAWLNTAFNGDADVAYGALLVVAGAFVWARARGESTAAGTARLDAWWLAVPAGMLVAFGDIKTDPLLFAAFARWGTSWATSHLPRLLRLFHDTESPASPSTA